MEDGNPLGVMDEEDGGDEEECAVVARIPDTFLNRKESSGAATMQDPAAPGSSSNGNDHQTDGGGDEEDGPLRLESRATLVLEMQEFVNEMKRKSARRLKVLEQLHVGQKEKLSVEETEKMNKGLETIAMLDAKLQELERKSSRSTPTFDHSDSSRCSDSNAAKRLRDERKRRQRYAKIKRSLESLDALDPQSHAHIIRNIVMGPNARYFTLTPEEETMVEELLQMQDLVDDDGDSNSIISSHVTTAFDVEGQEAIRLAEIDCKLDPYKESHSYCSASPLASASTPSGKAYLGYESSSPMASASTPTESYFGKLESMPPGSFSGEFTRHHEALTKALKPFAGTSTVDDYLGELKERREYEEKMEEIDKKLRSIQTAETPSTISEEQMLQLLIDSRREQEVHQSVSTFQKLA